MRYEQLAGEIDRALAFMRRFGIDDDEFHPVDFYSSHEALLLEYEHALTRIDSRTQTPYDVSGHFLWIGERTRQLDGAHVELMRHVRNPIGVKLGPSTTADDALALADRLDPDQRAGPAHLHHPDGRGQDPRGAAAAGREGDRGRRRGRLGLRPDARQHLRGPNGYKTRRFDDVIDEVQGFFDVHEALGTWPGGVHVELTGDDVTECVGGGDELVEADLVNRYETLCDPRLNRGSRSSSRSWSPRCSARRDPVLLALRRPPRVLA